VGHPTATKESEGEDRSNVALHGPSYLALLYTKSHQPGLDLTNDNQHKSWHQLMVILV
jgi:hypothetical protein